MSTISAVGGGNSAWPDVSASRGNAMKEKMFAKADSDGSGEVDGSELQAMLDHMAQRGGAAAASSTSTTSSGSTSAADLLGKMDSDGNGSLSSAELDSGMKRLMPPPSSTVNFAQQRSGGEGGGGGPGGPGGAGGPPSGPPPGPPPADSSDSTDASSSTSSSIDPLDTNEDGTVSTQERMAGELESALQALATAADTNGDNKISRSEADTFKTNLNSALSSLQGQGAGGTEGVATRGTAHRGQSAETSSNGNNASASADGASGAGSERLKKLVALVTQQYQQAAANASQLGVGGTMSVAA